MRRFIITLLILLSCSSFTFANKPKKVFITSEYTYVCNDNESKNEGIINAIREAKYEALQKEFGIMVNGNEIYDIVESNNEVKSNFISTSSSDVSGEWITEPKTNYTVGFDELSKCYKIHVVLEGYAREIVRSDIDIRTSVLIRPDDDPERECLEVKSDQNLYLYFKSPVNGYLLVYLLDENNKAYRMLPYNNCEDSNMPIKAMKDYVFFDYNRDNGTDLKLFTDQPSVANRMVIIFSQNPIHMATDNKSNARLNGNYYEPNNINVEKFREYLGKMRNKDTSVQVIEKVIYISK